VGAGGGLAAVAEMAGVSLQTEQTETQTTVASSAAWVSSSSSSSSSSKSKSQLIAPVMYTHTTQTTKKRNIFQIKYSPEQFGDILFGRPAKLTEDDCPQPHTYPSCISWKCKICRLENKFTPADTDEHSSDDPG